MYKSFLNMIVCPKCKKQLKLEIIKEENDEVIEGRLICEDEHIWIIKDGVVNLESEEQTFMNNWKDYYKDIDYEEFDRKVDAMKPEMAKYANQLTKEKILELIKSKEAKNIIDIATGRGMLLTYLAENFTSDMNLVCVDLSHEVLKYDRLKVNKINPSLKVNYVACDATNLPFKNEAFDLSTSFFGIMNMGDMVSQGIDEGVRVAKDGLINLAVIIKDDNPKIDEVNKYLKDSNYDFDVRGACESNCLKVHQGEGKFGVTVEKTYENIAVKNENVIPIEGEWFAYQLYQVK
ncbi:class I SAM-dependent methyltransferase [Clostridiaceae bacterium M8S5]|nr:class I SAM-dependent methyltransferase [Clostridiaceae bacterium M8S5]